MKRNIKAVAAAVGTAALIAIAAGSVAPVPASAQGYVSGSVYGPSYYPSYQYRHYRYGNGTGTVRDRRRDPHDDR